MGSPRCKLDQSGHDSTISPHKKTLRVLFDARKFGHGGIGTTIRGAVSALAKQAALELSAVIAPGQGELLPPGVTAIEDDTRDLSLDHLFKFSKRLNLSQFDLIHVPHYFVPLGISIPLVVTVHDTTHISHPERFYYPLIARRMISYATQKARIVITVSQASRAALLELGVPSQKIRVIANAAPFSMVSQQFGSKPRPAADAIDKFELLGVFSNLKPHKGLSDLLIAFTSARSKHPNLTLTLAGLGFSYSSHRLVDLARRTPGVSVLGAQSQQQLSQLYSACDAVIIPSLAEGFGLMAAEAHAHNKAVIVRPVAALIENLAPTDLCAPDFSTSALEKLICDAAQSRPAAPSREFLEIEQRRLDPGEIARATLDVYREACA